MPNLLLAITIIALGWYGLKFFARAPPRLVAKTIRVGGGIVAGLFGLFLLLRGQAEAGMALIGAGLWAAGFMALPGRGKFAWRPKQASGHSNVRSAAISMELDHATGAIGGSVIAGPQTGRPLDSLTLSECEALYAWCLRDDPDGARLLQPYLDRRFPGWGQTGQAQGDTRRSDGRRAGSTTLSEEEAYKVLGLGKGASRDDVVRAHRALMKKFHPDYGGTTELAARVNEAKEVLLRRIG